MAPDTDGTALIHDSDESSPGLLSLHVGYHRYCTALLRHASSRIRTISSDTEMLVHGVTHVKAVRTFEVYNRGDATEMDGHGADSVHGSRCRWSSD